MNIRILFFLLMVLSFVVTSCASAQTFTTEARVHQPAGSNLTPSGYDHPKTEVNTSQPLYGEEKILLYLPAPANIGTIQTANASVETVILAPSIQTESLLSVIPIAMMIFSASEQLHTVILAIPADPSLQVIKSPSLIQLQMNYPGVIEILRTWYTNAYSDRVTELQELKDEKEAIRFIKGNSF